MITAALKAKIDSLGITEAQVENQLDYFKNGFPFLQIEAAATIDNGIIKLTDSELNELTSLYDDKKADNEIVKFVPASGAASRMFKNLFAFLDGDGSIEKDDFARTFIENISSFAFYEDLEAVLKEQGTSIEKCIADKAYQKIVAALLLDEGLGYGQLPKALLKFHAYPEGNRTPAEEHFIEGVDYALGKNNTVKLHFTVSPEHQERFEKHVAEAKAYMEKEFKCTFDISFSQQKKSTDTIAVNMDNTPFEEEDGSILFRPAGHGALLENLNDIDADLIFIKNIDNVVPDRLKETTTIFKKAIGGLLLKTQETVFDALRTLDESDASEDIMKVQKVVTDSLHIKLPSHYRNFSTSGKKDYLKEKLNRPIRVCGMVENKGEPGGGPFWVADKDGTLSLQIGETAQLDAKAAKTKKILKAASHFNPTDLVCAVKDYKGKAFDLMKFRDPETGFITEKSKGGKDLKAQELPGLWNGSMADWNTLFVEVPLITFNPVKTINDLLRKEHQ